MTPGARTADSTTNLVAALKGLKAIRPNAMYGSGIVVTLTHLDGKPVVDPFVLPGESFDGVNLGLRKGLTNALRHRKQMLLMEIESAAKSLDLDGVLEADTRPELRKG